jgi:hypothetical protein
VPVVPDVFVQVHRELIIRLAAQHRLPAVYPYRFFVTSGGLMSYGLDTHRVSTSSVVRRSDFKGRLAGRPACAGARNLKAGR